jgi:hypothetical protein
MKPVVVLLAVLIGLAALGSTLSTIDQLQHPDRAGAAIGHDASDCLERVDCAGAAAASVLTAALLAAAVVVTPVTPPLAERRARSTRPSSGRVLDGGLYRPPRAGS